MKIQLLTFGNIAEAVGSQVMDIDDVTSTDQLREKLYLFYPELKTRRFAIAVNEVLTTEDTLIRENDIVALLPPFSGG